MPQFIQTQQAHDSNFSVLKEINIFDENGIARFDSTPEATLSENIVIGNFFKEAPIEMIEKISRSPDLEWIIYLLLALLLGIALIWYFLPEMGSSFFNINVNKTKTRAAENSSNTPGLLISFFFFLNYLIGFSVFIFVLLKWLFPLSTVGFSDWFILIYAGILVITFYLFRVLFIRTTGLLFRTKQQALEQQMLYINADNTLGVLLIPVLIIVLFIKLDFFLIIGAILVVTVYIFKWFQTFILGKSISGFSLLHLFLYLCTLEIIPLLVLIKLIEKGII